MNELHLKEDIRNKMHALTKEVGEIINPLSINKKLFAQFNLKFLSNTQILSDYEQAQVISFVMKYKYLPEYSEPEYKEDNDKTCFKRIDHIIHALNEYKSIIHNEKESVYYETIHKICQNKSQLIVLSDKNNQNVTEEFANNLDKNCASIRTIIGNFDFSYIYNGILQHSDSNYSKKFIEDYISGELNYILAKHYFLLSHVKKLLHYHNKLLRRLNPLELGNL